MRLGMKRVLIALTVSGGLAFGVPASGLAAGGPHSFAVGGGKTVFGEQFSFSAHNNPNNAPSGFLVFDAPVGTAGPFSLQGPVQCLIVSGNKATFGVVIKKGTSQGLGDISGRGFYVNVQDEPGGTPDFLSNSDFFTESNPGQNCAGHTQPAVKMVEKGNITVNDAS
jgi:hypothetical protein